MCKYCNLDITQNQKEFGCQHDGWSIMFEPTDAGWFLVSPSFLDTPIDYCPWCGRELKAFTPLRKTDKEISQELLEELVVRLGELVGDKLNVDRFDYRYYWEAYTKFRDDWYKRQGS